MRASVCVPVCVCTRIRVYESLGSGSPPGKQSVATRPHGQAPTPQERAAAGPHPHTNVYGTFTAENPALETASEPRAHQNRPEREAHSHKGILYSQEREPSTLITGCDELNRVSHPKPLFWTRTGDRVFTEVSKLTL